ncbi:MAG: phosphotransferase [Nocardiopsaceae bacterium]|nr:phosphotransferase [Nocardiopsaceae bacterium]
MFTKPGDLPESAIAGALKHHWGFGAASLVYQAVGFGSHHWLATDRTGHRLFVTADDLGAKLHTVRDTPEEAFKRLSSAFETARALRSDAGLSFVIAPVPTSDGKVVAWLSDRYSLVVHPYVAGEPAGQDGQFAKDEDRRTVVDMLIQIHGAHVIGARADDFVVPKLDSLQALIDQTGAEWGPGPYARPAKDLLEAHVRDLTALIQAYQNMASRVAARQERMVVTHGEPHASNVIATGEGLVLVDWDTTLLAPPERDLSHLADDDPSVLHHYANATGTEIDSEALAMYRLWWDLCEIAGYLVLFRAPHDNDADTRESWSELRHYLPPAARWSALVQAHRVSNTS